MEKISNKGEPQNFLAFEHRAEKFMHLCLGRGPEWAIKQEYLALKKLAKEWAENGTLDLNEAYGYLDGGLLNIGRAELDNLALSFAYLTRGTQSYLNIMLYYASFPARPASTVHRTRRATHSQKIA